MSRRTIIALVVLGAALTLTGMLGAGGASAAPRAQGSIVGGYRADPAEWPFIAVLYVGGRFNCGGSVISSTEVLTAAHCARGVRVSKMRIVTGRPNLKETSVGQTIAVAAKRVHPDYAINQRHDLAVLTLAEPTIAPPVMIASEAEDATFSVPGTALRVAGYGARDLFGYLFPRLLKQTVERVLSTRRCRRVYGRFFSGRTMICAQGGRIPFARGIRTQVCRGDSGGPLVADTPAGPRQLGVVSFGGFFCGDPYSPSSYARVADALDFIGVGG
jgi:secreted trypsin-like serine protease